MLHKLAVITVLYRNYTILDDFFASLDKQTDIDFRVYVADLTEEKKGYEYPNYVTYIPERNCGYAYGVNKAIQQAIEEGYDMFCVMNSDVFVKGDFVAKVKRNLEHHPRSLLGGKIYYAPGYEFHKERYPDTDLGKVLWYAGGENDWKNCTTDHRGVDEVDRGQYNTFAKTDFITGCLLCYDKQVFEKVGKWDESYFLYYEDADFCERTKKADIPLYYDPAVVIWHKNAASTGGSGSPIHLEFQKRNQLIFGLKYAPFRTKLHLLKNYVSDFLNSICKCNE
ncbi:MAG: glycosyltransferase family 2 protein [Patescibacteria group bacterium]